jgi:hypothetical protein
MRGRARSRRGHSTGPPQRSSLPELTNDTAAVLVEALPGGYPNLLGPDEQERVRLAYGQRLAEKRAYRPFGA